MHQKYSSETQADWNVLHKYKKWATQSIDELTHFSSSNPSQGSTTYTIPRATIEDEGSYVCKGQSLAGDIEDIVQIIVLREGIDDDSDIGPEYDDNNNNNNSPYNGYPTSDDTNQVYAEDTIVAIIGKMFVPLKMLKLKTLQFLSRGKC